MKVLVTGAGGFAGRHLCRALLREGHWVAGTVESFPSSPAQDVSHLHVLEHVSRVELDVRDADRCRSIVDSIRPDWIFHLAALTFVPASLDSPVETYRVNFLGTLNVLEAVRQSCPSTRFVFVSSSEVYGRPRYLPIDELHPLAPVNPYSGSKAAADLLCFQYAESYGLDIIRVRPFNHSGPGQSDSFVISALSRQVAEIEVRLREPMLKVGNLDNRRDFSDVRDVVQAYIAAAEKGRRGVAYNVCSGSSHSVRELLEWLLEASRAQTASPGQRIAGQEVVVMADPTRIRPDEVPEVLGSNKAALDELQWAPVIPLRQTVTDCLDWWRAQLRTVGSTTEE
ncbi:MAG: GDP-mannose 4,6-dehydratase [Acidobacteriota bacterium]